VLSLGEMSDIRKGADGGVVITISTPTPDRYKDCVMVEGLDLSNYSKNPIVLLNHDYQGLPVEDEKKQVATTLDLLRRASGQRVRGWLSPARSQSNATLDLIAAAPTGYHMVWREGMPAWADARTVPEIADLAAPPA
jgi:hypothetical protein